jgi:hypothetical protein
MSGQDALGTSERRAAATLALTSEHAATLALTSECAAATRRPPPRPPLPPRPSTAVLDTTTRRRRALVELERRVAQLEAQGRDLERRNDELRRQVACRHAVAEWSEVVERVVGRAGNGDGDRQPWCAESLQHRACPARTTTDEAASAPLPEASPAAQAAAAVAMAVAGAGGAAGEQAAIQSALEAAEKEQMLRASVLAMMARQQQQQQQLRPPPPGPGGDGGSPGPGGGTTPTPTPHPLTTTASILAATSAVLERMVGELRDEASEMRTEEYARTVSELNARMGLAIWRHVGKGSLGGASAEALAALEAEIEPFLVRGIARVAAVSRYSPELTRRVMELDLDTLRPLPLTPGGGDRHDRDAEDARLVRAARAAAYSRAQLSMLACMYEHHLPGARRAEDRLREAAAAAAATAAAAIAANGGGGPDVAIIEGTLREVEGALLEAAANGRSATASLFQVATPAQLAVLCASLHPQTLLMTSALRGAWLVWREDAAALEE